MTNPTHDVEIQGHVVFCWHCTCNACAPAREMASASEKQAGDPPTEPVRLTCRRPYETHNVSGFAVNFFHGEDGWITVEVPAIPGCFTQGKDREEALTNAAEAIAVSVEPSIAQMVTAEAVKQLRAAADTLSGRDATIARLTAERDSYRASALAGIEAVKQFNQDLQIAAASIAEQDVKLTQLAVERDDARAEVEEWATGAEEATRKILAAAGALQIGKIGEAEERLGEALEVLGAAD